MILIRKSIKGTSVVRAFLFSLNYALLVCHKTIVYFINTEYYCIVFCLIYGEERDLARVITSARNKVRLPKSECRGDRWFVNIHNTAAYIQYFHIFRSYSQYLLRGRNNGEKSKEYTLSMCNGSLKITYSCHTLGILF